MALTNPTDALEWVLRIGSVGVAIGSLEELRTVADIRPGGIADLGILLTRRGPTESIRCRLPVSPARKLATALSVIRLVASCGLIFGAGSSDVARWGSLVVAVSCLMSRWLSTLGTHAAGALTASTFSAGALATALGTSRAAGYALAFVAGQAALAYLASGVSKLQQPVWRQGRALALNSSTLTWGSPRLALALRRHTRTGYAMCWITMLGECAMPLALVAPIPVGLALLAFGASLHAAIAIEMGLNSFVWAFVATYPAIIWSAYWLAHQSPL